MSALFFTIIFRLKKYGESFFFFSLESSTKIENNNNKTWWKFSRKKKKIQTIKIIRSDYDDKHEK